MPAMIIYVSQTYDIINLHLPDTFVLLVLINISLNRPIIIFKVKKIYSLLF